MNHTNDPYFGAVATALAERKRLGLDFEPRPASAPYRQWGDNLDPESIKQMENACALPIAVKGALMPDAHVGYGLPIGGVLATRGAVIPYAVGVDIACRMKMTVLDLPVSALKGQSDRLENAIHEETRFGMGVAFSNHRQHDVMDEAWDVTPLTKRLKNKAWSQLGTSGSGNHFVEFGELTVENEAAGLARGTYLALLSHSGSRGAGSEIAGYYSRLAMDKHPELPKELAHLAWLNLDDEAGQEYWHAMELMGLYAAANHACIHRHIARHLGADVLYDLENHHNFAWKEVHDGEEVIVHRKGATPAGAGVLGIIPGSMASPAYVVRGKGVPESLNSASHGAGRKMSRTQAKASFTWSQTKKLLEDRGVKLISAGLDEVPMAYKNIDQVMAAQSDLVEPLARFFPRLVKMAPPGERPED
jgi:tRNA-splicing ligase RtcB